jgi:hypothetical protein
MEQRVRIDGNNAENFRTSFAKIAKEMNTVQEQVNKNSGKWSEEQKRKLRDLEEQAKKVKRESQRDYESSRLQIERDWRDDKIDSNERRFKLGELRFQSSEDRLQVNDLTENLRNLNDSLKSNTTESREERSVYRALMKQKVLGYSESMLNNTQSYGLMAGFNPGNMFGSAMAFASRGETTGEKLKYGLTGFVLQSLYEGVTKSLRDGETAQKAMNSVRGLGKDIIPRLLGEYISSSVESSSMAKLGINVAQSAEMRGKYARLTGGTNMPDFLKSYEIERAYNTDLSGMNSISRYLKGGSGADATLGLFKRLSGVGRFSEDNTSTSMERMSVYQQLVSNALGLNENVDPSSVSNIQSIFARELAVSGNNPQASRIISSFNSSISNPSGGAQQVLSLRAAQKAYPQYSNDISMLNRVVSQGLYGENGTKYAQELMNLISGTTSSDIERRLVADEYFKDLPISVRDSLYKKGFFNDAGMGGGFDDYSNLAQQNTFFGDRNQAENFNLAADVGEDVLIALDAFTGSLRAMIKFITSGGTTTPPIPRK